MLLFWAMFAGLHIPQYSMSLFWRECESLKYNIPYDGVGGFNSSSFTDACQSSVSIDGFANFYDSLFTVFQLIFINLTDFTNMKKVQSEMAPILVTVFVIFNSVIGLNFFIGLMANVLGGGDKENIEAHKSMVSF